MVEGILLIQWDDRAGAETHYHFPEKFVLDPKTLMHLFSVHQYSGKRGFVSLNQKDYTIASYYSGQEENYFLILILSNLENADEYEAILSDSLGELLAIKELDDKVRKMPELFKEISNLKNLTPEQLLGKIVFDPINYAVIKRLRKEIIVEESDLELWLKEIYPMYKIEMEKIAQTFLSANLIKISTFEGLPGRYWFMVKDLLIMRHPPANLLKKLTPQMLTPKMKDIYISQVQQYFSSIEFDEDECIHTIQRVFKSADNYSFFTILRDRTVSLEECKKMEMNFVIVDTDQIIKELTRLNVITTIKGDNNVEYYILKSDFKVMQYFPVNHLNVVLDLYRKNLQDPKILVKAMDYLKNEYYAMLAQEKKNAKIGTKNDVTTTDNSNSTQNMNQIEEIIKEEAI